MTWFLQLIINEIWHLRVLLLRLPPENGHLITLYDEKSGTRLFKALKRFFLENKWQSGPSVVSKTQDKRQLSVKILAICQLSLNPIQTLLIPLARRTENKTLDRHLSFNQMW